MSSSAELAGFPPVIKLTFNQPSDARPGRLMVETLVAGPSDITSLPRITSLTLKSDQFTGNWYDLRVVKTPRVRYGTMRTVLEDNRWKLWERVMTASYNKRDHLGKVVTGSKKTIPELLGLLTTGTGITIVQGELPPYDPPADWIGKTAGKCLEELLLNTGCRLVFNPVSNGYTFGLAGTGFTKPASTRIFRPAPKCNYKTLKVRSSPIRYEDTLDCTAKQVDKASGDLVALTDQTMPNNATENYGQTRYRLWQPNSVTHPEAHANSEVVYLDKRVKAHLFGAGTSLYESGRIVRDSFERNPYHVPLSPDSPNVIKAVEPTGGGIAFLTQHPVIISTGSSTIQQTCKVLTSYHIIENSELRRTVKTVQLDGTSGEKTVDVDWIKPIDSTLADIEADVWDTLHDQVAEAMSSRYKGEVGTVITPNCEDLKGSCHIGALKYQFRTGKKPRVYFTVSLGFTPGSEGDLA